MGAIGVADQQAEQFHTFGVDELFFSTTNRKGIIEKSNAIFEQISHYSHEELVGAPHNIIRHPDMPSGAFKLVWEQLQAGQPVCAYVKNLAKDGRSYWVLATHIPVGDSYLSVRLQPCVPELHDFCRDLYARVVDFERSCRAEGLTRSEAAAEGAVLIRAELAKRDISGMPGLTATLLPAEMAARTAETDGVPVRPDADGPLARLLESVQRLSVATEAQLASLEPQAEVAAQVRDSATALQPLLDKLFRLCQEANAGAQAVATRAQVLVNTAKGLTEMADRARVAIEEATEALGSASDRIMRTRTQIALSRLHIDMVGSFAAELIDGLQPDGAESAISLLGQALTEGTTSMSVDVLNLPVELHTAAERAQAVVEAINTFRRWAIQFRNRISREGLWEELGHVTPQMDELLKHAFQPLAELERTAALCMQARVPFDLETIAEELMVIRESIAENHELQVRASLQGAMPG